MLEIRALRKSWPGFDLSVDLRLGEGEIGVILGPSGSGKSTLLRIIAGLDAPDGGAVFLGGRNLGGLPPEKRALGMVFQDLALFSHLSVRRNMEYGLRMLRMPRARREETVRELARSFSMEKLLDRRPNSLSGGEQQRTALARTLAPGPALVLLDEPLSSLDPFLRRRLRIEIADRLREAGVTALHVTHDIDEAFAIADTVFLMDGGRIVESGSAEELYERPRSAFTARFFGRGPLLLAEGLAVEDETIGVRTKLGIFRCPRPERGAETQAFSLGRGDCLFFPSEAARILGSECAQGEANIFHARVAATTFAGRYRRVALDCESMDSRGGALRLELEFPPYRRPKIGERLVLQVPEERCALLTEEPSGAGREEEDHA
ncbi:MAG: ABC transporter ATP-binding protein [Treponema sp.]|nr:ABC transporter ATP-binding protein [Treponema sp.]